MTQDHQNDRPKSPPQGDDRRPDRIKKGSNTAKEGGGAYAPHSEAESANPDRDPAKKKTGEF